MTSYLKEKKVEPIACIYCVRCKDKNINPKHLDHFNAYSMSHCLIPPSYNDCFLLTADRHYN